MDKNTPFALFLDLSKAFDTLDHDILLNKLKYYGIKDNALDLFQSYLSRRKQFVEFEGYKSQLMALKTGVPQGSILGPLLFIIYINDISNASKKFNAIVYADDTTLQSTLNSFHIDTSTSIESVNNEINKIYDWLLLNKLSLNISKTKFMIFHTPKKYIKHYRLKIAGIEIDQVDEFNFLGIILDKHLSWKPHMHKVSLKLSQTVGILNRLKRFLPTIILKTIYSSLFLSRINYGLLCWGFHSEQIFKLQKKAIRCLSNAKYNAHTEPLFKKHELLKINDLIILQTLKIFYKYSKKELPAYLLSFDLQTHSSQHDHYTRNNQNLLTPRVCLSLAQNSLRYQLPRVINNIPVHIIEKIHTHSLKGLIWYFKNITLSTYSESCEIQNCYICN